MRSRGELVTSTRYWVAGYAHRVGMSNSRLVTTEGAFFLFVARRYASSFVWAAGGPPRRYTYAGIVAARVAGDRE